MLFWKKPIFWVIYLVIIVIFIPVLVYFFKPQILSGLSYISKKVQTIKAVKPGKCLILEDKHCSKAEVIDWTNATGKKLKMIGFKNLPVGTPLFPPVNNSNVVLEKAPQGGNFKGFQATISDPNNPNLWYIITGDITPNQQGESFGSIGNTGITNAGEYQIIVYVLRRTGQVTAGDESVLRTMFAETKL